MKTTFDSMHDINFKESRVEISCEIDAVYCGKEGDDWNSPSVPPHWEADGDLHVTSVIFYHYDDTWTEITIGEGSILDYWFRSVLPTDLVDHLLEEECDVCYRDVQRWKTLEARGDI